MVKIPIMLPSLTFNLLPSEIFPWALVCLARRLLKFKKELMGVLLMLSLGMFGNMYFLEINPLLFLISIAAYLNATAVLIVSKEFTFQQINKLFSVYFILMAVVIGLQISGALSSFNSAFQMIIPRGSLSPLGEGAGGRGVTGLSSEPSRSAYEFFCVLYSFFIVRVMHSNRPKRVYSLLFLLIGLGFIMANKSFTGIALFCLFFTSIIFHTRLVFIFLFSISCIFVFAYENGVELQGRLSGLFEARSIEELFYWIEVQSYHRVPVIISSLNFLSTYPFGAGFGNVEFAQQLEMSGKSEYLNRLPFGLNLLTEVGIFTIFPLAFYTIYRCLASGLLLIMMPLLLTIIFVSDPGNPIPFLSILYIFKGVKFDPNHQT